MSIVERALQKARERSRAEGTIDGAVPEHAAAPAGSVAPNPNDRVAERGLAVGARSVEASVTPKQVKVNLSDLRSFGYLPGVETERQLAEEFRRIKRPLVSRAQNSHADSDKRSQLIMVSSALPNEGKTFISINLALSLALEKDINVVLIDGDFAKQNITSVFGGTGQLGFLDAVRDVHLDIETLIHDTMISGLRVLFAGNRSATDTELLASKQMEKVIDDLIKKDPHRVVLIDSSPLLLTSDTHELVRAVGQLVIVVRSAVTVQRALTDALGSLAPGPKVGFIFNQVPRSSLSIDGYYGYGDYKT